MERTTWNIFVCGIAGLFYTEHSPESRREHLSRMLAQLRHRGPDEEGHFFDECVALGTARLSIVDIVNGQQPIGDNRGRYWLAFNGEIYNYIELRADLERLGFAFSTRSDGEVLLNAWIAWGADSLQKLNGGFACCIYDRREHVLVLARDRYGKRPLYYAGLNAGGMAFGSEIKSFLAHDSFSLAFDAEQIASIFNLWTPLEDGSAFRNIKQVPAGAYLVADGASTSIRHYAPLNLNVELLSISESEAVARVHDALARSVEIRMRGDVEFGVYLSGGLDSAVVARLMSDRSSARLKSFSIGFDDPEFDETADQRSIANMLDTDHVHLRVSDDDIANTFPQALWHAEIPVFRSAFVPMFLLSSAVRAHGVKAVLTGEGADEAFLGYDIFKETLLRESWATLDTETRHSKLGALYPYLRGFKQYDVTSLAALFGQFSVDLTAPLFSHQIRFHNSKLATRLLHARADGFGGLKSLVKAHSESFASMTRVRKAQWLEYKTLLAGYLLSTQGDRMSLAHGVENRCPFLDPNVVNLACATNLLFDDGYDEKYLLKKAFAAKLPANILKKPKQPYRAPDAKAFLSRQPAYLECIRSGAELRKIDVLNAAFCEKFVNMMFAKQFDRISQAENQAFMLLLSLALLQQLFVERKGWVNRGADSLSARAIDGRTLSCA